MWGYVRPCDPGQSAAELFRGRALCLWNCCSIPSIIDTFKIDYDNHEVYVNGQVLNEDYIYEPTVSRGDGAIPNNVLITVPEGHVIVLGDNRNHSADSRYSVIGLVSHNKIYGRAFAINWPLDRIRLF